MENVTVDFEAKLDEAIKKDNLHEIVSLVSSIRKDHSHLLANPSILRKFLSCLVKIFRFFLNLLKSSRTKAI